MQVDYARHYARSHPDGAQHIRDLESLFQSWLGAHLPPPGATIVDVGCGRGYALAWLQRLGFASVRGIDVDAGQVAYARQAGLPVDLVEDTVHHLEERPASCDCVLLMDVLEHVPHDQQLDLLRAAARALRPGGRLLCTVPNATSPTSSYWRYFDYTHRTLFTRESLDFALGEAGLAVQRVGPAEFLRRPRALCWPPAKSTLRWWLQRFTRLPQRLALVGELGWRAGWNTPLSPNLVAVAIRP